MATTEVIILAGGRGVRMRSNVPKALQEIAGRPMLSHLLNCVRDSGIDRTHIVHANAAEQLKQQIKDTDIVWTLQSEPLGTAHAVQQALPKVDPESIVIVLYADNPMVRPDTVSKLIKVAQHDKLALLTINLDNPDGFGRIIRNDDGKIINIIEHKDASPDQLKVKEVNVGPIAVSAKLLTEWIEKIDNNNSQGEYYLTDIVGIALNEGISVESCSTTSEIETTGVNSRLDQARLERMYQFETAQDLMAEGVRVIDPNRFDLRGSCSAGKDCVIDINVILEGRVELADSVRIGPQCVIRNSIIQSNVIIEANCVIDEAVIKAGATIGPFARIRPGSVIGENCKVGNFVEVNRSELGKNSKASHLTYIGDSEIGEDVNIGAGVVTCNYDGKSKHKTIIGDRAFIGSNSSLVAPLEVGKDSIIGAGSTITKSVKDGYLAVERAPTREFDGQEVRSIRRQKLHKK